jgi:hypothetical protein
MKTGFTRLENGFVPKTAHEDLVRRVEGIENNQSWAVRQLVGPILGALALVAVAIQYFI